jgi:hypothetical protein
VPAPAVPLTPAVPAPAVPEAPALDPALPVVPALPASGLRLDPPPHPRKPTAIAAVKTTEKAKFRISKSPNLVGGQRDRMAEQIQNKTATASPAATT